MSSEPRKASADIRAAIQEALGDPARRALDFNSSSKSMRYLILWDLTEEGLYTDLAEGLEQDRLFLKPKTSPKQNQRYQCVLSYPEDNDLEAIEVHVTLSPNGEPLFVKVSVHPSDTAQKLPPISI